MPGTTRYSATFDRTYEEEDRVDPSPPTNARRSRSLSWQANSGLDGRQYTPFGGRPPGQRSSSTDNGPAKGTEHIPTRTAKTAVKAHNNPFQFVKVGTCPLYKKAEEQLKKAKDVKKPDVLKEEEEEWQTNLDSWKSRRRKMSEDVFRRQEEIKQLELEEQTSQVSQKKTKTFSEMVESRATRGRALSLCLLTSPLEFQNWEFENKTHKNGSCSYTDESGENSTVNSEDEGVSVRRMGESSKSESDINRTNGNAHIEQNGSTQNGNFKLPDNVQIKPKENSYIDSGLESISSSHRAGDTPDSGSDFSQDSNSSIDCDSPRTGVNVLEEFNSKPSQVSEGQEIVIKLHLNGKGQDFGFTFFGGKDEGQVLVASILEGSKAESSDMHLGDRIITIDGKDVKSKKDIEIAAMLQKARENGHINLLLWRHTKTTVNTNGFSTDEKHNQPSQQENIDAKSYEKSIESENEMYVDDFEELQRQSELLTSTKKSETTCTNIQAQAIGNKSPTLNKDAIPLKTSSENSTAPKLTENISVSAVEEQNKNEPKTNSELNSENQKKNVVKVKRVRRKGVYALNVDSNQNPKEVISTNSLIPLSPVSELPSPADETKTLSSALSSNHSKSLCSSLNQVTNNEKSKEVEIKLNSPNIQESDKIISTKPKTCTPEDVSPTDSEKAEGKIKPVIIPSASTIIKNNEKRFLTEIPQNEKPKLPPTPKKVKVKVKKGTLSENTSVTSPTKNEPTSATNLLTYTPAVTKEKEHIESKSAHTIADTPTKIANSVQNAVTWEKSVISPETVAITPATKIVTEKSEVLMSNSTVCVEAENCSSLTNNKQSKNTTTNDDKSKTITQKKVRSKSKGISSDNATITSVNMKEPVSSILITDASATSVIKENEPTEAKCTHKKADEQEKTKSAENVAQTRENDVTSSGTTLVLPAAKVVTAQNKMLTSDSTTCIKTSNSLSSNKHPKDMITADDDDKSKTVLQKKVKSKVKGTVSNNACTSAPNVIDVSSLSVHADATMPSSIKEKEPIKSKSTLKTLDKEVKIKSGVENTEQTREIGAISSGTNSVISPTKAITLQNEVLASDSAICIEAICIEAASLSSFTNNKKPKNMIFDNDKSSTVAQKKVKSISKGITSDNASTDSSNVTELHSSVLNSDVPATSAAKEKETIGSKSINKIPVKQVKIKNSMENTVPTRENGPISSNISVRPATESITLQNEALTSDSTVSNADGNISPKINMKLEGVNCSSVTNDKQLKILISDDSKSKAVTQKKVRSKSKGTSDNGSITSSNGKESSSSVVHTDVSATFPTKEKDPSESKSTETIGYKQVKIINKVKSFEVPQTRESSLSSETTTVTSATEPATLNKVPTSLNTVSNYNGNHSLVNNSKIEAANFLTSVICNKQLKSPSEEDKPKTITQKKVKAKSKGIAKEHIPSDSQQVGVETCFSSLSNTLESSNKITVEESNVKNEQKGTVFSFNKQVPKSETTVSPLTRENGVLPDGITTPSSTKDKTCNAIASADKTRNMSLKIVRENESMNLSSSQIAKAKLPKTPQAEKTKPAFPQKKENSKIKEKGNVSLASTTINDNISNNESQKLPSATVPSCNTVNNISSVASDKKADSYTTTTEISKSVVTQEERSKVSVTKKTRNKSGKKNTNCQKVNTSAKQNEDFKNSNDSLNIVYQSQPKNISSENLSNNVKNSENYINKKAVSTDLVPDVPPVEKVAEEMEKLILEQLEEEERAKELLPEMKTSVNTSEHLLTAPPKLVEPPKEKPPPPPAATNEGNQKETSLKRINSTKRIKKEIYKRRSNFLGIDNADENIVCHEPSIPPPPALEEILKAEMELDRQSRLKIESEAAERLTLEEKEIMQKEREIIESLESEERQKMLLNGTEDCENMPNSSSDLSSEQDRIELLKNERKRIESERQLTDEQQQILLEEKLLREREELIREQEAIKSTVPLCDSSLSVSANKANILKPAISSLPSETQSNALLLGANGDGKDLTLNSEVSENKSEEKIKVLQKPAVPPKPLKKKEAIRKERERLRQEQEALQREREEHRQKLMLEQEELLKNQKSHAPDAPVSRLGPLPPLVQPTFPSQLTTTTNTTPNTRESASFPSRSHHGSPNSATGSMNTVELMGPPIVRQNRLPTPRKAVQKEAWGQQKMPSVHKQNHDSLPESRYNQNHWLIQEAEMRRITELKERQRTAQLPCSQTHLAEDDVCSNPPRVPVISPSHNSHLNYPVQDKMWNYGQSNMPLKKYPPPVVKEPPLHTIYPRETVSQQPPTKPSRVVPMERQEQMLSVSGRKRCSHCNEELGRGAAMIIESLQLYYHIHCFQCCVCQAQLGNGSCGTDVRVRNNKLHCHNCYSNDEAGLKFSQV